MDFLNIPMDIAENLDKIWKLFQIFVGTKPQRSLYETVHQIPVLFLEEWKQWWVVSRQKSE